MKLGESCTKHEVLKHHQVLSNSDEKQKSFMYNIANAQSVH